MILIVGGAFQGKEALARKMCPDTSQIYLNMQDVILEWMKEGKDPYLEADVFMNTHPDSVITLEEMGSGIIPMDAFEREYREVCGRIGCRWAMRATAVYRVIMGVAMRIK
ncbi:bifunctional adenosylcobinamide kinase/adenosylcobinamide-phosphate guanylyltransferase [Eubacterium oxidoreducens]|uniref:Adenosylcobinamide kinase /adenosylcobinamide-phosphate guanylyltransferase n=1 Tax=Eubacterium oxidoreducens TaxID=1732 RepID=A0A1G6BI55_EUBOX|nr:bifunctional adenosylcobinamide kinase/adenosylcobinamide-phosphate guanylyltransferase [Eubacterium oxidoreducens]SDB20249.1 adenosylcobinamide kinase /adenosylcobinamide-phosphate guanylyltransferase [Eubacterium oxidoreducens]